MGQYICSYKIFCDLNEMPRNLLDHRPLYYVPSLIANFKVGESIQKNASYSKWHLKIMILCSYFYMDKLVLFLKVCYAFE